MKILPFIFILAMVPSVLAVGVQQGQEKTIINVPDGETRVFYLNVVSPAQENVGSDSSWILIEGNDSYKLPSGGTVSLKISVTVPNGQGIGKYDAKISAGSTALTNLEIHVTLPTDEIKTLQSLSDVNKKISDMESMVNSKLQEQENKIQSKIDDLYGDVTSSIDDIKNHYGSVDQLENDKESLEYQISILQNETIELERKNNDLEITGNIIRTETPVLFVIGILLGAAGMYLFHRKLHKYL